MSHRRRNRKRNRHSISHFWRGDCEDTKTRYFPTKEEAWAYVLGQIRKTIKAFEKEGETKIDFEEVKAKLFDEGLVQVEYAGCSAWWDNFSYDFVKAKQTI